eukprot:15473-Eustigmatos_ZCMA.PRE.1
MTTRPGAMMMKRRAAMTMLRVVKGMVMTMMRRRRKVLEKPRAMAGPMNPPARSPRRARSRMDHWR